MSGFEPRTMKVTLYQGDWQQRIDEARTAAQLAADSKIAEPRGLGEEPESLRLARVHDELVEQATKEGCVVVTLKALGRKRWAQLVTENPPRTDDETPEQVRKADAALGVNDAAMGDLLVPESIVSIEGSDIAVEDLVDVISSAQFDLLYGMAFALNRGAGSDPKLASRLTPSLSSDVTEN